MTQSGIVEAIRAKRLPVIAIPVLLIGVSCGSDDPVTVPPSAVNSTDGAATAPVVVTVAEGTAPEDPVTTELAATPELSDPPPTTEPEPPPTSESEPDPLATEPPPEPSEPPPTSESEPEPLEPPPTSAPEPPEPLATEPPPEPSEPPPTSESEPDPPPTTESEPDPPTVTPPLVDGAALFEMECTVCHSEGRSGANLQWSSLEEEEIVSVIANGRDGTFMSPWEDRLTSEEIKAVAAYVKSLQQG